GQDGVRGGSGAGSVTGRGKWGLRAARTAGEDGLGRVGPDGPEGALYIQKLGDVLRLPSAIGKEIQRRKVGRASDANLRVGEGHLALRFGDVRAPLEEIRRQSRIQRGRFSVQFLRSEL